MTARMVDGDGQPIAYGTKVRIGKGKTVWIVRRPEPARGEVGLIRDAPGPIRNRYVDPSQLHRIEAPR